MQTRCPRCQALTEIDDAALQRLRRMVNCPQCSARYYALRHSGDSTAPGAGSAPPPVGGDLLAHAAGSSGNRVPQSAAGTRDGDEWLANLPKNLAAALLAKTAGAPREPPQHDDAQAATPTVPATAPVARPGHTPEAPAAGVETNSEAGDSPERVGSAAETRSADAADEPLPHSPARDESASAPVVLGPSDASDVGTDDGSIGPAPAAGTSAAMPPGQEVEPVPVYVPPPRRWASRAALSWALGCLLLAMLLAAQVGWIKRVALYHNPHTRPWVAQACQHLPCDLPPIRDAAKLQLLSRDVRPDPDHSGALIITATVRNNAGFAQPWPTVTVELSDLGGNPVAMRRFRPARYVPDPSRRAAGIAAGTTAVVAFEVADPGKRAVSFRFGLQ